MVNWSKIKILNCKVINRIICATRIKNKFHLYSTNINLINVHATTEEKDKSDKDIFYDILEDTYDTCPQNDIKIVAGELNAKIGEDLSSMSNRGT